MFLARTVTHSSVRECQRRIDAREYQEWQELYKQEPWGDDWMQAATIAATFVKVMTGKRANPAKFIPRARPRQDPREIEAQLHVWARMHNARVEKAQREARQSRP